MLCLCGWVMKAQHAINSQFLILLMLHNLSIDRKKMLKYMSKVRWNNFMFRHLRISLATIFMLYAFKKLYHYNLEYAFSWKIANRIILILLSKYLKKNKIIQFWLYTISIIWHRICFLFDLQLFYVNVVSYFLCNLQNNNVIRTSSNKEYTFLFKNNINFEIWELRSN